MIKRVFLPAVFLGGCTAGLLHDGDLLSEGMLTLEMSAYTRGGSDPLPSLSANESKIHVVRSPEVDIVIHSLQTDGVRFSSSCGSSDAWMELGDTRKALDLSSFGNFSHGGQIRVAVEFRREQRVSSCQELQFQVDLQPPTLTTDISTSPLVERNFADPSAWSFSGTCSELGRAVKLTLGASIVETNCESSGQYTFNLPTNSLAAGDYNLSLEQSDLAGNNSSLARSFRVLPEPAPSGTSISINTGASHTRFSNVTLSLGSTQAAQMKISQGGTCSGGSWEAYATSKSWTLSGTNSTQSVSVLYRNSTGVESACVSDSIDHDNLAPTVALNALPNSARVNAASVSSYSFSGTCETGTPVQIVIDNDPMTTTTVSCNSGSFSWPSNLVNLDEGSHVVQASQTDAAGNLGSSSSQSFSVDTVAPMLTIFSAPTVNAANRANFTFSGTCLGMEDGRIVTLQSYDPVEGWDAMGSGFAPACTSGAWTVSGNLTPYGTNIGLVRAVGSDLAGNAAAPAQRSLTLDWIPPSGATATLVSASNTNSSSATVAISCNSAGGNATERIQSLSSSPPSPDDDLWTSCANGNISVSLSLGTNNFYFFFRDAAWNVTSPAQHISVSYDTTAPTVTISSPTTGSTVSGTSVSATGSCVSSESSTVAISYGGSGLSGPSSASCASNSWSATLTSANGGQSASFTVTQTDVHGNSGSATSSLTLGTASNVWRTLASAPASLSQNAQAVWTGTEALVVDTSGKYYGYNPTTDTWRTLSSTGAPTARTHAPGILWGDIKTDGTKGLWVFGGTISSAATKELSSYDPSADTWINHSTTNLVAGGIPIGLLSSTSELVFASKISFTNVALQRLELGSSATSVSNSTSVGLYCNASTRGSARVNPTLKLFFLGLECEFDTSYWGQSLYFNGSSWITPSTTSAPEGFRGSTAVLVNSEVIIESGVWGDYGGDYPSTSLHAFNPDTNTWRKVAYNGGAVSRSNAVSIWTGTRMLSFGGTLNSNYSRTNLITSFNPSSNTWTTLSSTGAPTARVPGAHVWTGTEWLIFGGNTSTGDVATSFGYRP